MGAVLLALGVLIIVLTGPGGALLLGCLAAGTGSTYLCGIRLRLEERVAYGAVIGPMVFSAVTFLLALALGLRLATVVLGLVPALAVGAWGWWRAGRQVLPDVIEAASRWRRGEPWPLWILLLVCWPFTLVLLARAYTYTAGGLEAGNVGVYGDWAAHLTYASSFAFANNFPPDFPIHPGHQMSYPFMVDFWAATLIPVGTSLTSSLVLTSAMLGLALPAVVYFAGLRLVGGRWAAALAVLVFVLSGGLGFLLLFEKAGPGVTLFTQEPSLNLDWLNPVLAWILPQRSVLFGYALVPLGLGILWSAREGDDWGPYAWTGTLTGLAPIFNLYAFGTLLAMGTIWALLERRRRWWAFLAPCAVLGLPVAAWMSTGGAASVRLQPGWMASSDGHTDNAVWFWIWNTGPLVPLMAVAMLWPGTLGRELAIRLAPIWLWFLVPNLVVFQTWDQDNTKFFSYWALLGALPVAALLVRLGRSSVAGAAIAALLFASLTFSGFLDLHRALDPNLNTSLFVDRGGLEAAVWVRGHTDRRAVFLVAPVHNEPIPCLTGRPVVAGYNGWLWSYGFSDWATLPAVAQGMLAGQAGTPELIRRYHVAYVVIGPNEASTANPGYWDAAGQIVYRADGYTIYRTPAA
jgi:hypothetical protein